MDMTLAVVVKRLGETFLWFESEKTQENNANICAWIEKRQTDT